ncbi:ribosomal protection-like ABC-F family protein [Neobacillus thermocopriae]|uniref:ABC-F type ribosomal protection protein n=1 Tax=Neobacillus thermocopriae TaxID=1215031 RepID=A0A6B3TUJ4_9BACI|nr:ABC-F type ribosomal protection protein [Neobacillus thermocopriae]MED3623618.1 ABC-F type ribosomal protection protein [Neobacillus thermocopriae]MED3714518.1 ABC-F type ribosomal protection protein [Neobacillus thermocopriae]NEX80016.1 ABC-F type ribosomal protection protein [Neobacillus thermocopriae]
MNNNRVILKITGLEKSYQSRKVLDHIQFEMKNGERIGLVGYNGTGKTTLANLIFGKLQPDNGTIELAKDLKVGYLLQSIDYQLNVIHESFTTSNNQDFFQIASELGLKKIYEWEQSRLSNLSGGEKLKLALSNVWASKPDLLILDEPTNHLDYKGIKWLTSEMKKFDGAVLIISHDRHFLDQIVTRVVEIENGKLHSYNGNYTDYRKEKQKKIETQRHYYEVQQRQIERIEEQLHQLKTWSEKAHSRSTKEEGYKEYHRVKAKKRDQQIKSKMKRLHQELSKKKVEKPLEEPKVKFEFDSNGKRGKRIIEAKNLSKSYPGRILFQNSQFYINHGERIGILGENGCGKTTLIKMILEEEPVTNGDLWKSQSLNIAYLSQDVADLPEDITPIEALGLYDREQIFKARTILANLGLKEQYITKPIGTLSLGERTRVKLVDILMKDYDVLILDEPTNHMDLPSREQLEKTLNEYTGTIILVSHDYYFLNKLCDKLIVFEGQQVKRLEMKPDEYLNKNHHEKDNKQETLMILENQIAAILGELSTLDQNDPKYQLLDQQFNELIKQKRNLIR